MILIGGNLKIKKGGIMDQEEIWKKIAKLYLINSIWLYIVVVVQTISVAVRGSQDSFSMGMLFLALFWAIGVIHYGRRDFFICYGLNPYYSYKYAGLIKAWRTRLATLTIIYGIIFLVGTYLFGLQGTPLFIRIFSIVLFILAIGLLFFDGLPGVLRLLKESRSKER